MISLIEDFLKSVEVDPQLAEIEGFSTMTFRVFLNRLCNSLIGVKYLEIGTWKGSTLFAASANNIGTFVGVDNFSEFEGREQARQNLRDKNCVLIEGSWEEESIQKLLLGFSPFQIFFYDSHHSFDSQFSAIVKGQILWADQVIVLIDDWNWDSVELGTREGIKAIAEDWKVEYEKIFKTSRNGNPIWWNGLGIFVFSRRPKKS
jgi:hypothetical protein